MEAEDASPQKGLKSREIEQGYSVKLPQREMIPSGQELQLGGAPLKKPVLVPQLPGITVKLLDGM